ncbi:MAG: hypothetical protein WB771_08335 [Solirubrobacterales bacterium]
MDEVRHHCAQCLAEIYANGHQTPAGELLCSPCYSALWGPQATDAFRVMVEQHTRPMNGHPLSAQTR